MIAHPKLLVESPLDRAENGSRHDIVIRANFGIRPTSP
jgi:hypothetical protein